LRYGDTLSLDFYSLPEDFKPPKEFIDIAKELDRHYIVSRYPNIYPEDTFMDYYTESKARRVIEYTRKIIEFCRSKGIQA
jgi:HEPN domain-containing protein